MDTNTLNYIEMNARNDIENSIRRVTGKDILQLLEERAELLAALEAITERAEDVSSRICVENRSEGVSQAAHVRHMASHLEQHAKIARATITKAKG